MSVLVLRHIKVEGPGLLGKMAQERGIPLETLDVGPRTQWPSLKAYRGILILGGPQSVYDEARWPELELENAFLQGVLAEKIPCLGICLGAQLIAKALGAKAYRNPKGQEIGWAALEFDSKALQHPAFRGLPKSLQAFHWHGDTFDLPEQALHLASSQSTPNQAFAWGDHALALQFHLEVEAKDIRDWMKEYPEQAQGRLKDGEVEAQLAAHYGPYKAAGEQVFGWFLDKVEAQG
jgi:GMP synthase (glutamine-hydrolysing)